MSIRFGPVGLNFNLHIHRFKYQRISATHSWFFSEELATQVGATSQSGSTISRLMKNNETNPQASHRGPLQECLPKQPRRPRKTRREQGDLVTFKKPRRNSLLFVSQVLCLLVIKTSVYSLAVAPGRGGCFRHSRPDRHSAEVGRQVLVKDPRVYVLLRSPLCLA